MLHTAQQETPTATAPPPLGELVAPSAPALEPPRTPEEKASLLADIRAFLGRPEVQAGLMQFAIGALQPLAPGDTPLGALARAGAGGLQAAGRVKTQATEREEKEFERERKLSAEELEQDKLTAARTRTEITAESREIVADTGAASREGIAQLDREAALARLEASRVSFRVLSDKEKAALGINLGSIAQLNELTNEIKIEGRSGTLKAVMDLRATQAQGSPVTRFASQEQILASEGNLVPVPKGLQLRVTDAGFELATEGQQLPSSEETRLLQRVSSSRELLTNVGTLLDQVEQGGRQVSGPLGAFKGLINVTLASFFPALFSGKRALFETNVKLVKEASKRAVSDENRFTDQDRAYVNALFPTTGFFGNPDQAEAKMQVMTAFFLRRLAPDLQAVGIATVDIPTFEVADLLLLSAKGLLTPTEIFQALEFVFPEQPSDLKSLLTTMAGEGFSDEEMDSVIRELFPEALAQ